MVEVPRSQLAQIAVRKVYTIPDAPLVLNVPVGKTKHIFVIEYSTADITIERNMGTVVSPVWELVDVAIANSLLKVNDIDSPFFRAHTQLRLTGAENDTVALTYYCL